MGQAGCGIQTRSQRVEGRHGYGHPPRGSQRVDRRRRAHRRTRFSDRLLVLLMRHDEHDWQSLATRGGESDGGVRWGGGWRTELRLRRYRAAVDLADRIRRSRLRNGYVGGCAHAHLEFTQELHRHSQEGLDVPCGGSGPRP